MKNKLITKETDYGWGSVVGGRGGGKYLLLA